MPLAMAYESDPRAIRPVALYANVIGFLFERRDGSTRLRNQGFSNYQKHEEFLLAF
jgi:hypothetical protein